MTTLTSTPYKDLNIGQSATRVHSVSHRDIALFAAASGDINPLHLDEDYAKNTVFGGCIAHGIFTGGLVSAAIAMDLPGPGTVYLSQQLDFRLPVKPGDTLTTTVTITDKVDRRRRVTLACEVRNQHDKRVVTGTAVVMAPEHSETIEARPVEL